VSGVALRRRWPTGCNLQATTWTCECVSTPTVVTPCGVGVCVGTPIVVTRRGTSNSCHTLQGVYVGAPRCFYTPWYIAHLSHPAGCLCGYTPLLSHPMVHPTLVTPCRVFVWVNTVVVAHCGTSHCWRPLHGRVSVWIYSGYTAWTCECVGTPLGTVHACMSVGSPLGTLHGRVSVWVHP